MILEQGEFIDAYFTNDDRNEIQATWHDFGVDSYYNVFIPVDLENENYQKLLEKYNLKQIKNNTNERSASEEEAFKTLVLGEALKKGLVYDPANVEVDNLLRVDHLFDLPEGNIGEEFLFNLKLRIFDMPELLNVEWSEETQELKKRLREAKTPLECLYIAGKFLYE